MTSLRRLPVLLVALALVGVVAACGSSSGPTTTTPKAAKAQCQYTASAANAAKKAQLPPSTPAKDEPTELTISTDRGDIKVSLDAAKAPCAVNSFVSLAKQGYFDHTKCHRLTDQGLYVLQCGDPSATGMGGPGYSFRDELVKNDPRLQPCVQQTDQSGNQVCTYTAGTVAMANSGPDTNGSQFFLVYKDSQLGNAYTVFGRMSAAGVKVVRSVAAAGVAADGTSPKTPVTIISVK